MKSYFLSLGTKSVTLVPQIRDKSEIFIPQVQKIVNPLYGQSATVDINKLAKWCVQNFCKALLSNCLSIKDAEFEPRTKMFEIK